MGHVRLFALSSVLGLLLSEAVLIQQACLTIGLAFLLEALLSYASRELMMARWVMMTGSGLALVALSGWWIVYGGVLLSAIHAERVLFVGTNWLAREIDRRLAEMPQLGMVTVGYVGHLEN